MLIAIIFVLCIVVVYLLAAAVLFRLLRQKTPAAISACDRVILTLAVVGVLCLAYGRFVEPNWLATTHVVIPSAKIPPGNRPIRIAHFSDLHSEVRPRLEDGLVAAVTAAHPDVIVFTGDSVNTLSAIPVMRECLAALARIAPTFVVRGNWDTDHWPGVDLFGETGVQELDGTAERLEVGGTPIWIAGLRYDGSPSVTELERPISVPGVFRFSLSSAGFDERSRGGTCRFVLRRAYSWRAGRASVVRRHDYVVEVRQTL